VNLSFVDEEMKEVKKWEREIIRLENGKTRKVFK